MLDTEGRDIPEGAKVKLTKPKSSYVIGNGNPQVGTRWECEGKFLGGGSVLWDNGVRNGYSSYELTIVDGCISIWLESWP